MRADLDCADICHATRQLLTRAGADGTILKGLLIPAEARDEEAPRRTGEHEHLGPPAPG